MCMSVHVIERIQVGNRGCALAQEGEKEACVSKQESECTSECVKRQRKRESVCGSTCTVCTRGATLRVAETEAECGSARKVVWLGKRCLYK